MAGLEAGQVLLSRTKKVLRVKNLKNKMLQAGKVECLVKEAAVSFLQLQSSLRTSNEISGGLIGTPCSIPALALCWHIGRRRWAGCLARLCGRGSQAIHGQALSRQPMNLLITSQPSIPLLQTTSPPPEGAFLLTCSSCFHQL